VKTRLLSIDMRGKPSGTQWLIDQVAVLPTREHRSADHAVARAVLMLVEMRLQPMEEPC
jgi:hypothetical protein